MEEKSSDSNKATDNIQEFKEDRTAHDDKVLDILEK